VAVVYASDADLAASDFLPADLAGEVGGDAARLLARASRLIDRVLLRAVYAVDGDGAPTDTKIIEALRDATCAQAAWWVETGDEAGAASSVQAASGAGPTWSGPLQRIAPDAETVLAAAVDTGGCPLLAGPWQN
jgi:hypothetical protein